MRAWVFVATVLLVGTGIGLAVTGRLEQFLEPILVYLSPGPPKLYLVPVDFDPFAEEYICELRLAHNLCI